MRFFSDELVLTNMKKIGDKPNDISFSDLQLVVLYIYIYINRGFQRTIKNLTDPDNLLERFHNTSINFLNYFFFSSQKRLSSKFIKVLILRKLKWFHHQNDATPRLSLINSRVIAPGGGGSIRVHWLRFAISYESLLFGWVIRPKNWPTWCTYQFSYYQDLTCPNLTKEISEISIGAIIQNHHGWGNGCALPDETKVSHVEWAFSKSY